MTKLAGTTLALLFLSLGAVAAAPPPIHSVVGTVESISALDAPGDVTLVVRQTVSLTPVTIVVPRPEVPAEYRGVVQGLASHGPSPRPGEMVRATGWLVLGQPLVATVVEVRNGAACTGRCIDFVDGARGYRLWLHRSFFDLTRAKFKDTALWVYTSRILAQHNRLESARTAVWLAGRADRLFGYYYRDPRRIDAWIPRFGSPDLSESVPRLARLATELGVKEVLVLGLPFMPSEWGQMFVGYDRGYFPLQVYVPGKSLRRAC